MPHLEQKHSLATRLFHWANVPILAGMIGSGLLIYWANDVYAIRLGGITLVKFFPESFYQVFHIGHRLAEGMAWHFTFMWLFALNGVLYVAYTGWSGEWRFLLPNRHTFAEAWQVVRHDLGLRKEPLPRRKFNGAQRLAYTGVIAMGAGSLLTGLAIYKPVQLAWLTMLLGGYPAARLEHFALTIGYLLFFLIHITQIVRAGWNNFRAMVIGVEVTADGEGSCAKPARSGEEAIAQRTMSGSSRLHRDVAAAASPCGGRHRGPRRLGRLVTGLTSRSEVDGLPWPFRRVLELDERLGRAAFRTDRLAPFSTGNAARMPRVNGRIGLDGPIDPDSWRLRVGRTGGDERRSNRSLTPGRDPGTSPGRYDHRAQMHRGLERCRPPGRRDCPTSPR